MSYYRVFKPTAELVEKIRRKNGYSTYTIDDAKTELMLDCMSSHENGKTRDLLLHIKFSLRYIARLVAELEDECAVKMYDTKDETITYCGWEYKDSYCRYDEEDMVNSTAERLATMALIVKTPDWFDNNEKFYEKLNEINSNIEGFIEICKDIEIYRLMDMFKEFEDRKESSFYPDSYDDDDEVKCKKSETNETDDDMLEDGIAEESDDKVESADGDE